MKIALRLSALLFCFSFYCCTSDTGTITVTYQEATALYGTIDVIRNEPLLESAQEIINPGKIFIGDDFVLIGEEGEGIHVIDNSDRLSPSIASFINIPGNREFIIEGNILFAESHYDMVKIDLSELHNPQLIARVENAIQEEFVDADGHTLIGFSYEEKTETVDENDNFYQNVLEDQVVYIDFAKNVIPKSAVPSSFAGNSASQNGTVNRIARMDDYVYVVSNNNMIILNDDGTDFGSKVTRKEDIKDDMETIFPFENKLFIGSRSSMTIYDVSTSGQPIEAYDFDHATSCDPVLPVGEVAYITLRTADFSECPGNINALIALDISNLSQPEESAEIQMSSPFGMTTIGNELFVGEGKNGLKIFDITHPKDPKLVKEITDIEAYDIIVDPQNDDIVFIAGPNGLDQFTMGEASTLDLLSTVAAY